MYIDTNKMLKPILELETDSFETTPGSADQFLTSTDTGGQETSSHPSKVKHSATDKEFILIYGFIAFVVVLFLIKFFRRQLMSLFCIKREAQHEEHPASESLADVEQGEVDPNPDHSVNAPEDFRAVVNEFQRWLREGRLWSHYEDEDEEDMSEIIIDTVSSPHESVDIPEDFIKERVHSSPPDVVDIAEDVPEDIRVLVNEMLDWVTKTSMLPNCEDGEKTQEVEENHDPVSSPHHVVDIPEHVPEDIRVLLNEMLDWVTKTSMLPNCENGEQTEEVEANHDPVSSPHHTVDIR